MKRTIGAAEGPTRKQKKEEKEEGDAPRSLYYQPSMAAGHNCSMEARKVDGKVHTHCTCGIDKDGNKKGCGRLYFVIGADKQKWAEHCANVDSGHVFDGAKMTYVCDCHVHESQERARTKKSGPRIGNFKIGPVVSMTMHEVDKHGNEVPAPSGGGLNLAVSSESTRKSTADKRRDRIMHALSRVGLSSLVEDIDKYAEDRAGEHLARKARQDKDSREESRRSHQRDILAHKRAASSAAEEAATARENNLKDAMRVLQSNIESLSDVAQAVHQIKMVASKFEGDGEVRSKDVVNALRSESPTLASLVWSVLWELGKEKGTSSRNTHPPAFYMMYSVLHAANQKVNSLCRVKTQRDQCNEQ